MENNFELAEHTIKNLTLAGFFLVLIIYTIFSVVLHYHWHKYNINNQITKMTLTFYFVFTVPLIISLGLIAFFI